MSAPARTYRTRAIVLRARNLGEADKIVTLLTQEHGKVAAVAKGVRRLKSLLAGHLEFASEVDAGLHRGRNLDVITTAETIRAAFSGLSRPEALATAGLLAELVDAFCEPDLAVPDVYALLAAALRVVAASDEPARVIPRFELRLLDALGYGPACDVCVRCNLDFDGRAWADLEAGGLACAQCRPSAAALAFVEEDLESFRGLARPRHAVRRAVLYATPAAARAAEAFVNYHLGRAPKANRVLEGIGGQLPVLALDVGERRIGVAVSDPSASFALPLAPVVRSDVRTDLAAIVAIAGERGARTIVVGDPLRLTGERGIAAEKIDRFCAQLARVFDGAIERVDERLTTAQATRTLISADVSRSKRKKVVDGIAAALILETYLASRKRPDT